jgi:hypothetical protein
MYGKIDKRRGTMRWECAVRTRERVATRHRRLMADPVTAAQRRAKQRAEWPERTADPLYRLQRCLNELARVRY